MNARPTTTNHSNDHTPGTPRHAKNQYLMTSQKRPQPTPFPHLQAARAAHPPSLTAPGRLHILGKLLGR